MPFRLHVEPNTKPLTRVEFAQRGPRAIALDGYVGEGPYFDPVLLQHNANHHEGCDRLATRATCAQVMIGLRMGLYEQFIDELGNFDADGYVNDCDNDVGMSTWLLANPELATHAMNARLNRLCGMVDLLDATAGCYPFPPGLPSMRIMNWIFEPYWEFRKSGQLDRRDAAQFHRVLSDVHGRISEYWGGNRIQELPYDGRFKIIGQGRHDWKLIHEIGSNARTAIFAKGIKAFIAVRQRPDGRRVLTFCRQSLGVCFPMNRLYANFNLADPVPGEKHGGSDIVGGSARVGGCGLSEERIIELTDQTIDEEIAA